MLGIGQLIGRYGIARATPSRSAMLRRIWRFLAHCPYSGGGQILIGVLFTTVAMASTPALARELSPQAPGWNELSGEQRTILAPVEAEWNRLPDYQRQRLLGAAKSYPRLDSAQQRRFAARLQQWSRLTLEERNLARKRFQEWHALPPSQRLEIEHQWHQWAAANGADNSGGVPAK